MAFWSGKAQDVASDTGLHELYGVEYPIGIS